MNYNAMQLKYNIVSQLKTVNETFLISNFRLFCNFHFPSICGRCIICVTIYIEGLEGYKCWMLIGSIFRSLKHDYSRPKSWLNSGYLGSFLPAFKLLLIYYFTV